MHRPPQATPVILCMHRPSQATPVILCAPVPPPCPHPSATAFPEAHTLPYSAARRRGVPTAGAASSSARQRQLSRLTELRKPRRNALLERLATILYRAWNIDGLDLLSKRAGDSLLLSEGQIDEEGHESPERLVLLRWILLRVVRLNSDAILRLKRKRRLGTVDDQNVLEVTVEEGEVLAVLAVGIRSCIAIETVAEEAPWIELVDHHVRRV
mmetsp:Transcript_35052/g.92043  ORF Transcript_35052/g.92043 Transcript_35052/m.92043 type:complete len:212 (-) Transcript_35052:460-1095(-)